LIGHGFPSGTILPADVTVTLNPTSQGGGPSGSTAANGVTVVTGSTERIKFQVPIEVATETPYRVSIAGTTSTGTAFISGNTASLTLNAPVAITTASPLPTGTAGTNYSATLTATGGSGQYT
jgi:hypothetical protein